MSSFHGWRCALLCLGGTARAVRASPAAPLRPNVLVLFADDLGFNQLNIPDMPMGYTGVSGAIKTPHLAQIAQEGTVFMQWYSGFHVCTPSRASIMTGRLPVRLGLGDGVLSASAVGGLQHNETTMAETVGKLGYVSAMFGKWHLGQREVYLPHHRGFDSYFGIPFSCDMGCSPWHGPDAMDPSRCGRSAGQPTPLPLLRGHPGSDATVEEAPCDLSTLTARYADFGASFITQQSAAKKPWLLYASFSHVHVTDANYSKANPPPGYSNWQFSSPKFCGSSGRGGTGDAVQEMDDAVGQLMAAVKAAGVDSNTITFVSSDNGNPEYGDMLGNLPLRGYKASNWEGGVREPGLVHWPGHIAAGAISWALVATYDIPVTVIALAGGQLPDDRVFDGRDLTATLLHGAPSPRTCIFHWHDSGGYSGVSNGGQQGLSAVRCGDYKAHFSTQNDFAHEANRGKSWPVGTQNPPLLFNLRKSPSETDNIDPTSAEYRLQMKLINDARQQHLQSITPVCSQNYEVARGGCGGNNISYAVCGDRQSKSKYPQWPECTISPAAWGAKSCV
jgi:arylsulfatase A